MTDFRAKLKPKPNGDAYVFGPDEPTNVLRPLIKTKALIFPYTPQVQFGYSAKYEGTDYVHTIYGYNSYVKSAPDNISISADFTAQTDEEAQYLLAVLHFFKSITKSYFGVNSLELAGTPPPVLLFDYLGAYMFKDTPVIIKDVKYTLEPKVSYVPVDVSKIKKIGDGPESDQRITYVPSLININITLDTQYNPKKLRDEFDLDKFRTGALLNKGFI